MRRKIIMISISLAGICFLIMQSQCASTSANRLQCTNITCKTVRGDDGVERLHMEWDFNQDPVPFLQSKELVVIMGIGRFSMQWFNRDSMLWNSQSSQFGRRLRLQPNIVILEERFGAKQFQPTVSEDKYSYEIPWSEYFGPETHLFFYIPRIKLSIDYFKGNTNRFSCPNMTF